MLGTGLVAESDERPAPELDDQRRRYYRITELGRSVARGEVARMEALVRVAHDTSLVQPG
jgi:hypothetical protein